MRTPSSVSSAIRYALVAAAVVGSVVVLAAAKKSNFTPHEKAFYADASVVEYVNPGLTITVVSAKIAANGTISVEYTLADPTGAALDLAGVVTPGPVSLSFLAAYIPSGQEQYSSYITHVVTAATGGATATQATTDSGGTTQTVSTGEYIYTFKTVAPTGFNANATTRIGIYGSRNLTQWDLGTSYADTFYDFIPSGNGTPQPRDVVRNADCNQCHGSAITATSTNGLAAHGGSRRSVGVCIICHQPQTSDPNSGNSLDMKVFIHQIHMGSSLPSVQAGTPYQIIGYQNSVNDFSTVVYPANVERCQTCHNPKNGAAQTSAWLTSPSRAACGSCHDNVNFATGVNHVNLPQYDDTQCSTCHIPKGESDFDASIMGAHVVAEDSSSVPGINYTLVSVANGVAGKAPTVTFTAKDNSGKPIPMSSFSTIQMTMSGPTTDYGAVSFGSTVTTPGYVTESVTGASCGSSGTCTYTFTHSIPSGAKGTYAIGIEGRISITLQPGTVVATTTNYAGANQVIYFSVDGSPVTPRRAPVALANCNACHYKLEVHGSLRNNVVYCVLCHNPYNTDASVRVNATVAADKALPPQGINFAMMVHKIHTGTKLETQFGQDYIIVGNGGSHNDFGATFASVPAAIPNTGVRFPAMGPTGAVYDTAECYMCHANGAEAILPIGKNPVTDPQGLLNPSPATTSACTACHLNTSAFAHAVSQTDPKLGESCDVCHGTGAPFSATQVHAGQ
jgi:OmcA/MtrC family decaheme c-type cytochrome